MSATWRLLAEETPERGDVSMARDRAIQIAHSRGLVPPTLRLYRWVRPTVTLGRFQPASDVDAQVCAIRGVDVVRRFTGGRGVLHDDEVTYSIVAGIADGIPRGVAASYRMLSGMLVEAYGILGVAAQVTARPRGKAGSSACYLHATHADLSIGVAKLSGSAQVWHEKTVLQHGSVVRARDVELEAQVFSLSADDTDALRSCTATLAELLETVPADGEIRDALATGLERVLGVRLEVGAVTVAEEQLAQELLHDVQIPSADRVKSRSRGD